VIASFCIAIDAHFAEGDKVDVFGQMGNVVEMGMRSVKIKLIYSGEEVSIPNHKLINENIKTFKRWSKRRCKVKFVLDLKHARCGKDRFNDLCLKVQEEAVETCRGCVPSDPCCWMADISGAGLAFEVVFVIEEYNDDVALYKNAMMDIHLSILEILEEYDMELARPPCLVSSERV